MADAENPDFVVSKGDDGHRYAVPWSEEGSRVFTDHLADFDVSERGWELDLGVESDYPKFEDLVKRESLEVTHV